MLIYKPISKYLYAYSYIYKLYIYVYMHTKYLPEKYLKWLKQVKS